MGYHARISEAFSEATGLPLTRQSKYILFSDCHRGTGKANDNFLRNEFLFVAALKHYYHNGFTYLELGDGDELWENRSMKKIKEMHKESFGLIAKFYEQNRLYMIYGNHDMVKKNASFSKKNFQNFLRDERLHQHPLCPDICCHEGLILRDAERKKDIYLLHGHQADFRNSSLWRLTRFLVRYLWKNLELLGVPDPTSSAKNYTQKEKTEKRLAEWAKQNNHILIAGHTHRPMLGSRQSPYFNTGSCVHPMSITGIEIEKRCITLVKWSLGTGPEQAVYVIREPLGETVCIDDYV